MVYVSLITFGIIIGVVIILFTNHRQTVRLNEENSQIRSNLSAKCQEADMLRIQIEEQNEKNKIQILENEKKHIQYTEEISKHYEQQIKMLNEANINHQKIIANRYENQIVELKNSQLKQLEDLNTHHTRELKENKELLEHQLNERLQLVQEQLKTATEQLLKERSAELNSSNRSQMSSIIEPLKVIMSEMKKSMDDSRESFTKTTTSLGEQLKQMCNTTNSLGIEAEKLSKALRSGPKIQGDFGEMKLKDLLDKFGFTQGVEYDIQYTMKDKSGNIIRNNDTDNMMRPDVVLHYPDKKDVVIDSKTSLTSFINYINAEDDEQRVINLDKHVKSTRRHVEELSAKNYGQYSMNGGTTLNFVIMFVPHEAALQLAISADTSLWSYAFDRNVLITGEQNLFALLRLLQISWTQQRQAENQEQVFGLANTLIDRVGLFIERFDRIGRNIESTKNSFDEARKSLRGNQSFIGSARKLVEMGAKENSRRPLPEFESE